MITWAVAPLRRAFASLPVVVLLLAGACSADPHENGFLRLDQVGYAAGESKVAVLLAPRDAAEVSAAVIDESGRTVLSPVIGSSRGAWNAAFPDVRPIDLSPLTKPGTYRLRVSGMVEAKSPPFHIATPDQLFEPVARNAITYFQAHRDGAHQVSAWRHAPAHLQDRTATVYERPDFDERGRMTGELVEAGATVDVEGGWYDAGDYLKFTHTTAYALIALLIAQRDGLAVDGLGAEAQHGLDWLGKMWDADSRTLYTQVGIGSGVTTGDRPFLGDHDTWRLPEDDDRLAVQPGDERYYQRYRPVFRAAEPGAPISPNLAGRVAAAFALAAQVQAGNDPDRARASLATAAQIFALARTDDVDELVTAEPRSFYPEDSWTDDLAAGATELALAGRQLKDPRAQGWQREAIRWAKENADQGGDESLNVYDVSVLADAELMRLLGATGAETDTVVLRRDMERRLDAGVRASAGNLMRAATGYGGSDYASRQLGHVAAAKLYEHTFKDGRYATFATVQRGVVLGANGWGTSMVVGAGSTYPHCPHDQIATLTPDPAMGPGMTGAVVNGPNSAARVHELLADGQPNRCVSKALRRFDRDDVNYADDMRISANTEPSIDFTATGLLAFALTAQP